MRIVHIDHSRVLGGAERSVLELASEQERLGHDVTVLVGQEGPFAARLRQAGVGATSMDLPDVTVEAPASSGPLAAMAWLGAAPTAIARTRRTITSLAPAVIQAHTRKSQLLASAASAGRSRPPLVWHIRDGLPEARALRTALRWAMRMAAHAVAVSPWLADDYMRHGLVPKSGRIGIVPSGVRVDGLQQLRRHWLDGVRAPIVGFVGQIASWKAPHLLVDAAEHLRDLPEVRFRIVGDVMFPSAEGLYGEWLRDRIRRSTEASRISWAGGTSDPSTAFDSIDILVHPNTRPEPFGRVLVEAMAARRPIVTVPHGAAVDILAGDCATYVDPEGSSIAEGLRRLLTDPDLAARLADQAAARAPRFSPQRVAEMMELEYRFVA